MLCKFLKFMLLYTGHLDISFLNFFYISRTQFEIRKRINKFVSSFAFFVFKWTQCRWAFLLSVLQQHTPKSLLTVRTQTLVWVAVVSLWQIHTNTIVSARTWCACIDFLTMRTGKTAAALTLILLHARVG